MIRTKLLWCVLSTALQSLNKSALIMALKMGYEMMTSIILSVSSCFSYDPGHEKDPNCAPFAYSQCRFVNGCYCVSEMLRWIATLKQEAARFQLTIQTNNTCLHHTGINCTPCFRRKKGATIVPFTGSKLHSTVIDMI